MCRTTQALLQTIICMLQMLVRLLMTILLMIENVIRMILQTFYNILSFVLQILSLIPICLVFLVTSRLKCLICGGGGGGCPAPRGTTGDCLMTLLAFIILFFIFRATGILDKIFYSLGYSKTKSTPRPDNVRYQCKWRRSKVRKLLRKSWPKQDFTKTKVRGVKNDHKKYAFQKEKERLRYLKRNFNKTN